MTARRYPRLHPGRAKAITLERATMGYEQLQQQSRRLPDLSRESYAATGLERISPSELCDFRNRIEATAESAGYPERGLSTVQAVDRALAVEFARMELPLGEMLRADVWTWCAVHLLPHLVHWRFARADGSVSHDRYLGIVQRNALGRLWLRGCVFDRGPGSDDRWGLVTALSEDASVAILERTSIAADWRLARAVGEAWLLTKNRGLPADVLLRDGIIRVRIAFAITELGIYDDDELSDFVAKIMLSGAMQRN